MNEPAATGDALLAGRELLASRAWVRAYESLASADDAEALDGDDLEQLATAAYMAGRVDDFLSAIERAHHARVDEGEPLRAARCAFFLGVNLALRGELGRATGWFGRAERLVDRVGRDCVERGYLQMPVAMRDEAAGRLDDALAAAAKAAETGERFADADLFSLGAQTQGRILIKQGRLEAGLRLLDDAMLPVSSGEVSAIVTGVVYCGAIAGCEEAYELGRAREWTDSLARWCDEQPELVAFSGTCRAHRAELMQLDGAWTDALDEVRRARERAERAMNPGAAGQALYQQGELERRRGCYEAADAAYREANRRGREPQPGLALLRLAQGDRGAAVAAIRRALGEASEPLERARLLPAFAEIMLAAGDLAAARVASEELVAIARTHGGPMLGAIVDYVSGLVDLEAAEPGTALGSLRRAWQAWQELGAPYEAARTRVLVARACLALGDDDTAALELDEAHAVFESVGAAPDLALVASLRRRGAVRDTHGLTARELEVLRLVAAGKSNRQIAAELVVSEHTVARHVQNIFRKLGVSSRAGATGFAFEHELL